MTTVANDIAQNYIYIQSTESLIVKFNVAEDQAENVMTIRNSVLL